MSTPIHAYLIVDKDSGNPDWDADLHPTVAAAIESLCETKSFRRTVDDPTGEDLTYWAEVYAIHPVGPAMDPNLAGALADPEGHALVQAIHARMETATLPALVVRHDTDDALSLVAALRAVEKIHVPVRQTNHRGGRDMCRHDTYDWPCPTIRAIQEALA